jgi:hypothetical protein
MNRFVLSWVAALCGIFCVVLSTDAAWAERKVALVVGNTQYKNPSLVLLNPRNDALPFSVLWILRLCSRSTPTSAISTWP